MKTADAHNANLTGRVETSGAGLNPLRDAIATYNVIISELRAYIKKLESENASLRSFSFSDLEAFGSNSSDIGLSEKDGVYSVSLKHKPTGKVGRVELPASFGSWLDELRLAAKTDGKWCK